MTQQRRFIARRALIALGVGFWVILLTFASLRAVAAGPQWGLALARSPAGQAVASAVEDNEKAWIAGLRPGDEIILVDGFDAATLGDVELPIGAHEITFRGSDGVIRSVAAEVMSSPLIGLLTAGALLFVLLGSVVFRWSADPVTGRLFLLLSGSFATALQAVLPARLGYPWAVYLTAAAALLAGASLFGLFLSFPRPFRHTRPVLVMSVLVATGLALAQLSEVLMPPAASELRDAATWGWMVLNLIGAVVLLAARAARSSDRRYLAPLLIGTAVGVGPMVLFHALPRAMGAQSLAPEVAAIAAIPISFAYSILRHQIFGLDALMRRVLLHGMAAGRGVGRWLD